MLQYKAKQKMMHTKEWLLPIACFCKLLVVLQEGIIITVEVTTR